MVRGRAYIVCTAWEWSEGSGDTEGRRADGQGSVGRHSTDGEECLKTHADKDKMKRGGGTEQGSVIRDQGAKLGR